MAPAPTVDALAPYLDEYGFEYAVEAGFREPSSVADRLPAPARRPSHPAPIRRSAACSASYARGGRGRDRDVLLGASALRNVDFAHALATAVNDWLQPSGSTATRACARRSSSSPTIPAGAAAEIERRAGDPRFVQVLLPSGRPAVRQPGPTGRCSRQRFATDGRSPSTSAAPPEPADAGRLAELLRQADAGMAHVFQAQADEPDSRGRVRALPRAAGRAARAASAGCRRCCRASTRSWALQFPWVKRAPSQTIREHVRAAVQPIGTTPGPGRARPARRPDRRRRVPRRATPPSRPHTRRPSPAQLPPEVDRRIRRRRP